MPLYLTDDERADERGHRWPVGRRLTEAEADRFQARARRSDGRIRITQMGGCYHYEIRVEPCRACGQPMVHTSWWWSRENRLAWCSARRCLRCRMDQRNQRRRDRRATALEHRTCARCGAPLRVQRRSHRFCNATCRQQAHRARREAAGSIAVDPRGLFTGLFTDDDVAGGTLEPKRARPASRDGSRDSEKLERSGGRPASRDTSRPRRRQRTWIRSRRRPTSRDTSKPTARRKERR